MTAEKTGAPDDSPGTPQRPGTDALNRVARDGDGVDLPSDLLNAREAAAVLGVTLSRLYTLTWKRRLAFWRVGRGQGRLYFDHEELAAYIQSRNRIQRVERAPRWREW